MDKLKQSFPLALVIWSVTNLCQVSLAQYWVPIQPPVPSHDIMFPGVRERSENQNQESDPAPRFRSSNSSSSSTSKLTPERIRAYANEPDSLTRLWRASVCYDRAMGKNDVKIDGHILSTSEMAILIEELKC
jgi:hypothetical protein